MLSCRASLPLSGRHGHCPAYVETVTLLAARAPRLRKAVRHAARAGHSYVVLDGTLIPIDRGACTRPSRRTTSGATLTGTAGRCVDGDSVLRAARIIEQIKIQIPQNEQWSHAWERVS